MLPEGMSIEIPSVPLPSWADMYSMLSLFDMDELDVTIDGANVTQLAPADPHRFMIGFLWPSTVLGNTFFGPFSNYATDGFAAPAGRVLSWYKLFDYGPLVARQWTAISSGSQPVKVYTVKYSG